jgi:plastocyanin domain-containing protein
MLIKKAVIGGLVSLGFAFNAPSGKAVAQMTHLMPSTENSQANQFHRLSQPLWLKAGVTAGALGLMGLEIWWFLLSKPKSQRAKTHQGIATKKAT